MTDGDLPDEAPDDHQLRHRQLNPSLKIVLGILAGSAAIWLVVSTAGGLSDAIDALGRMRVGFVALATGFATLQLALFGLQLLWLARRSGPFVYADALGLALVVFGFGAVTPAAPAEGLAIASHELRRRGRPKRQARLTIGFSEWFAQRTFYAVAALDLVAVVALGHLSLTDAWPFVVVAMVVLVALAGTALAARRPRSARRIAAVMRTIRIRRPSGATGGGDDAGDAWHAAAMAIVGSPRNRMRLAAVSAGAVLADTGTLWATCHAAGFHIHPELVLLARTVGTIASWVPFLPSGLGLVEAAIPAVLHRFGAPLEDALAATLVYRAVGTLLPAAAGGLAIGALRRANGGALGVRS